MSEIQRIRAEQYLTSLQELASLVHRNGGSPMELLHRQQRIGGGARIRISISASKMDAIEAFCRRHGWRYRSMRMGGQMTIDLPITPTEAQRAIAAARPELPPAGLGDQNE